LASLFPCHRVEVLLNEFGGPFGYRVDVAAWEAWEAREMMVMSMSSLEGQMGADPVILM
jgi:hypothetical protein